MRLRKAIPTPERAFETVATHALCEAHFADMLARVAYFSRPTPSAQPTEAGERDGRVVG